MQEQKIMINHEEINKAAELIDAIQKLYSVPRSKEEEEILHLINALKWRIHICLSEYQN